MTKIPTEVTEIHCQRFIEPHLSKAKHGYVSKQPLYKIFNCITYVPHTGCQWRNLPIEKDVDGRPVMSWQVPRYHFYKWRRDGSFQRLHDAGIMTIKYELNLSELTIDGSHSVAKKGANTSPTKAERKLKPAIFCR